MSTKKMMVVFSILTADFCGCAMTPRAPAGRSWGEMAPEFSVYQVLPNDVLRGTNYRLTELVPVQEYQYVFTIMSDFGEITAKGRHMLSLRLSELKSIEAASKLSKDPLIVDGILTPLRNTEKGLDIIINEPFDAIDRAPEGLELMVDQYIDPADRRAGSPTRRKIAIELDCDPETRNPILRKLLDELTLYKSGGSLLTEGAMIFIPIPGLGVLSMTAQMKELIVNSPPSVINGQMYRELGSAGVGNNTRFRFRYSSAFTTVQRLQLMEQFRALKGVQNRAALIEIAAEAHIESEALCTIHKGKMLAEIHERQQIQKLKFEGLFPLAVLGNGTHVLACPYDYVTSTREVNEYIDIYRTSYPNVTTVLINAGSISPTVLKKLEASRIRILEDGKLPDDQAKPAKEKYI